MPPRSKAASVESYTIGSTSAAAAQQKANSSSIADFELPKTTLTKLAKGSIPDNVKMQQDVVLALLRSSTLFISYLSAASHDQALARTGKSITASDVIKAITELDFGPADSLVPLLEIELAAYRKTVQSTKAQKQASKAAGAAKAKRRKSLAGAEDAEMGEAGEGVESVVGEDEADENQEIEDIDRREEMAHDANGTNGMDEENT